MESNCKQNRQQILAERHYYFISLLFYNGIPEYEKLQAWNYSSAFKNQYTLGTRRDPVAFKIKTDVWKLRTSDH